MNKNFLFQTIVLVWLLLTPIACSAAPTETLATPVPTILPVTSTTTPSPSPTITITPSATITPSLTPQPSPTSIPGAYIYADKGEYNVGLRSVQWYDPARNDRLIDAGVYYPGNTDKSLDQDAKPDVENGPYPLVIFSSIIDATYVWHSRLTIHLASHGYVVICISEIGNTYQGLITDRPLDVKYVFDHLDSLFDAEMVSVIDREHVGLIGYENGAYASFNAAGAQVDPMYWQENDIQLHELYRFYSGNKSQEEIWADVSDYRRQFGDIADGELWPAIAAIDADAVIGMEPTQLNLFGDRGLASLQVPTLILGNGDLGVLPSSYYAVASFFASIGTNEKEIITILVDDNYVRSVIKHFITAYFGYYLKGNSSDLAYFNEEFVDMHQDDLRWGVFK